MIAKENTYSTEKYGKAQGHFDERILLIINRNATLIKMYGLFFEVLHLWFNLGKMVEHSSFRFG